MWTEEFILALNTVSRSRRKVKLIGPSMPVRKGRWLRRSNGVLVRVPGLLYDANKTYRVIYHFGAQADWALVHTTDWTPKKGIEYKNLVLAGGIEAIAGPETINRASIELENVTFRKKLKPGIYLHWDEEDSKTLETRAPSEILILV